MLPGIYTSLMCQRSSIKHLDNRPIADRLSARSGTAREAKMRGEQYQRDFKAWEENPLSKASDKPKQNDPKYMNHVAAPLVEWLGDNPFEVFSATPLHIMGL